MRRIFMLLAILLLALGNGCAEREGAGARGFQLPPMVSNNNSNSGGA
jgi:hypothetical protein